MPTLSITKTFSDGNILTEADLDNIKSSVETFLNTTKIDSNNIQASGVATANIADLAVTTAKINGNAVTKAKIATDQQLPPGIIMAYSSTTAPTGWLYCDGTAVSRTTYADLFAIVSTAYGEGDGSTTFNLPDLRGRFLRGVDDGQGNDPDAGSRTAMNTGGNTGDNVGSVQSDATALPNTNFTTDSQGSHSHTYGVRNGSSGGSAIADWNSGAATDSPSTGSAGAHTHSVTSGGDNETRPLNANVAYIIKT